MGNGHHLFEHMISFKEPKEMLKIKWTALLLPLVKLTEQTAEAGLKLKCHKHRHTGDHTGPQNTECPLLHCLWGNKIFFKLPSTQKESTSWIPVVIMEIKASSKVLMLTEGSIMATAPGEPEKPQGWFLHLESR